MIAQEGQENKTHVQARYLRAPYLHFRHYVPEKITKTERLGPRTCRVQERDSSLVVQQVVMFQRLQRVLEGRTLVTQ